MIVLTFLIGMLPLVLIGWCGVRLLEGRASLLLPIERALYGAIIGPVIVAEVVFLLTAANIMKIDAAAFGVAIALPLFLFGGLLVRRNGWPRCTMANVRSWWSSVRLRMESLPRWRAMLLGALALWIIVKLSAGLVVLLGDPAYNDDVFNNWNYRAKVLMHEKDLVLDLTPDDGNSAVGVAAYPPTVPLIRIWLAIAGGGWNDQIIGLIAPWSYLLALALVFFAVRRMRGTWWGIAGLYILASLPLFFIHGITPYADLFLALHIAIAILPVCSAAMAETPEKRSSWLRIGALGAALLPMTKNEALLIHLPTIAVIAVLTIGWMILRGMLSAREARNALLWYAGLTALVLLPWLTYKWANGLPFGNAKSVDTHIVCQPMVLRALFITWVYEANFLLLPGVGVALLIMRWRTALQTPLLILTGCIAVTIAGLIGILTCTGLAAEALQQTGSARGVVQLLPVIVVLVTVLFADSVKRNP